MTFKANLTAYSAKDHMDSQSKEFLIAECPLNADDAAADKVYLSAVAIWVFVKNKSYSFPLNSLKSLSVEVRKKMGWVFVGSILIPLTTVAYMTHNLGGGITALMIMTAGILVFYYGWVGQPMLIINGENYERRFPLSTPHHALKKFIPWTNRHVEPLKKKTVFLEYPIQFWAQAQQEQAIMLPPQFPLHFQPPHPSAPESILLKLYYTGFDEQITFIIDDNNQQLQLFGQGVFPLTHCQTINKTGF